MTELRALGSLSQDEIRKVVEVSGSQPQSVRLTYRWLRGPREPVALGVGAGLADRRPALSMDLTTARKGWSGFGSVLV